MLIDSHCHLIEPIHKKTPAQLISGGKEAGVKKIITIGTTIEDSKQNVELAEKHEGVYATVGIYPHEHQDLTIEEIKDQIEPLLSSEKVVGIGECGIDTVGKDNERNIPDQVKLFEMQIELALKYALPIVIHNRNGDEKVVEILESYKNKGLTGVLHCFTSTWEVAEKVLATGFYLGFTGIITYPSGKNLWETVRNTPEDKILIETDAPFLTPQGFRKEINEPKYVKITAKTLAGIRKTSLENISRITYQNSCRLFSRMVQK